jgi:predicted TIM-barrel fold metal-dependent hydrolase
MALSGIGKVLLLPVLGATITENDQMSAMVEMFGQDQRFALGYCVPNSVSNDQIGEVVDAVARQHDVKALKIHPAVTGINLGTAHGMERIECMLRACRENGLSVVIHGGKSPAASTAENREFGILGNLQHIDWSLSGNPVVIAHAGSYGYDSEDLLQLIMPKLVSIMDKHDNVFTDISGVEIPTLCRLLNVVESERIVFGSDCLYYPQWRTMVCLLHALCKTFSTAEDHFVKITSSNPLKILNGGEFKSYNAGLQDATSGKVG